MAISDEFITYDSFKWTNNVEMESACLVQI